MVSIAESLNYRIFERKWRPGEALNGLTRACRILSVEQKPNPQKSLGLSRAQHLFGDRVVTPSPRHNVDSWVIHFIGPGKEGSRKTTYPFSGTTNASLFHKKISLLLQT